MFRFFGFTLALALAAACDSRPECVNGEMRYQGRPPRALFSYDRTCREDCFSLPVQKANEPRCDPTCEDVEVGSPAGALFGDRTLALADVDSLGGGLALVYSFGYVDEAGGTAPDGWGMTAVGPRTYLADQVDGNARFTMDVGVFEVEIDDDQLVVTDIVSTPIGAYPGRLEVLEASPLRIAGRFFLAWSTPTEQPQGEVIGCFDVNLSEVRDPGGASYQVILP